MEAFDCQHLGEEASAKAMGCLKVTWVYEMSFLGELPGTTPHQGIEFAIEKHSRHGTHSTFYVPRTLGEVRGHADPKS